MPTSLAHVHADTPMGANLVADGATFRVWAPNAKDVYVVGDFNGRNIDDASLLNPDSHGHWRGFVAGVKDRDRYRFHVVGKGSTGLKRDPYARELETPFPADCIIREKDFPWHETGYRTPDFSNFVIYQLHVGVFFTPNLPDKAGTFLDVAMKLPYLSDLGITAIQLLPIQDFPTETSLGYNGTDYYSPEMDFAVEDDKLGRYVTQVNQLLGKKGLTPYSVADLHGEMNQLKALIDVSHAYGIAVILDVVYNHAGGGFGDESLEFFDRQDTNGGWRNTLYFGGGTHAGGRVFDFGKPEVRELLIQNAKFFLDEYRVDGFRYDQTSVIDHDGWPDGWSFMQDLTSTVRYHRPSALQKAEYWNVNPYVVKASPEGAGFDTSLTDGLRIKIRDVIGNASQPDERPLDMSGLGESMWPGGFHEHWRFVQGPENHDLVKKDREMRVARLGHPDNPRSWYGRSRARVATGIGLTAPGIPMLFMGQEFLEDKQWSDSFEHDKGLLLHWAGLDKSDKQMADHLRFTRELIRLRWNQPALRGQGFRVVYDSNDNRVLAFHRWVPGEGRDVVVIIHLSAFNRFNYRIGFPGGGFWREVFNSDVYENWLNPNVAGNGTGVFADGPGMHDFWQSASLVLPANSVLVFAR
jgi:1,4-alpha-glucan branching enzyme